MLEKIKALFIFEMLGRPPEHIKETLGKLIEKLGKQKGIEVTKKTIHEPKKLEEEDKKEKRIDEGKEIFTTFAEVEIIADSINLILLIVLNMLPAHVEIINPSELNFKNFELSSLLNELTIKIHKYDEVAKVLVIDRNNIFNKLQETEQRIRELEREIKERANQR